MIFVEKRWEVAGLHLYIGGEWKLVYKVCNAAAAIFLKYAY